MREETKFEMKQDQKTRNEPETGVASTMTTEGSSELEANVVTVVEEVVETDVEVMKPDQGGVVKTAVIVEEVESRTVSDVVTDSRVYYSEVLQDKGIIDKGNIRSKVLQGKGIVRN